MKDTGPLLRDTDFPHLHRSKLASLQINLGYLCNLSCTHCHVNAGPKRTELMDRETVDLVLGFIDKQGITTLDLTGGAPEMNPHFRYLVEEARRRGCDVIDRCNLTILMEPGYEDLAAFLASQQVRIVASLPCYEEENVNQQRGKGVYQASIEALQKLNALGYGKEKNLLLDLVYNPGGPSLPPPQEQLQKEYKQQLGEKYAIVFGELLTITNMPISRFGSVLLAHNQFDDYLQLLKNNYSADNLSGVMCRTLLSVDWQGYVYDCDFNQMLHWPLRLSVDVAVIATDDKRVHLNELMALDLNGADIVVGEHCYGCTAGQGSSCAGALSA